MVDSVVVVKLSAGRPPAVVVPDCHLAEGEDAQRGSLISPVAVQILLETILISWDHQAVLRTLTIRVLVKHTAGSILLHTRQHPLTHLSNANGPRPITIFVDLEVQADHFAVLVERRRSTRTTFNR